MTASCTIYDIPSLSTGFLEVGSRPRGSRVHISQQHYRVLLKYPFPFRTDCSTVVSQSSARLDYVKRPSSPFCSERSAPKQPDLQSNPTAAGCSRPVSLIAKQAVESSAEDSMHGNSLLKRFSIDSVGHIRLT